MKLKKAQRHSVDLVFLIVLFLIFTFSSVSVILVSINSYKAVVEAGEENSSARTAVAYVREVIHQNDSNGGVGLCTFENRSAIGIDIGNDYMLYIYEYDKHLMELYAKVGAPVSVEAGEAVMEVQSFEVTEPEANIINISVVDNMGNYEKVVISTKSEKIE
ncbi:MAG: DUF4860 domain-containing protein [Pseudobutyrivibrio sp.]|nr:DUF4860 domain-containing protein [Pseudobutyrivibrio sp.]